MIDARKAKELEPHASNLIFVSNAQASEMLKAKLASLAIIRDSQNRPAYHFEPEAYGISNHLSTRHMLIVIPPRGPGTAARPFQEAPPTLIPSA